LKIAVFTKNRSNPAYAAARLGADRTAERLGAKTAHYVPSKDDDAAEQSALVLRALGERPNAIVFAPVHPAKVNVAIEAIHAAGIPVFGFVNPLPVGRAVSYVGSDDHALAFAAAKYLYDHLAGRGRVLLVSGPAESVTSIPRMQAFKEAAAGLPGIGIAGVCVGDYNRSKARLAVSEWLRGGVLDACLSANDVMALGALEALREAGRKAAIVGVNAIPEAVAAIKAGEMLASADFNAMHMCSLATECAIRHLQGEAVPEKIELPVRIVDRSNYHRWDLPFEQRAMPTLKEILA
jgi:ribose transport system substrate-binding protein